MESDEAPHLRKALEDEHPSVRREAAESLKKIKSEGASEP